MTTMVYSKRVRCVNKQSNDALVWCVALPGEIHFLASKKSSSKEKLTRAAAKVKRLVVCGLFCPVKNFRGMLRRAALGKRVKSTIAAMAEVLEGRDGPEGASLLRSRLEPQEARTTAVTKQAAAPVYLFLVGAVRAVPRMKSFGNVSIDPRPLRPLRPVTAPSDRIVPT